MRARTPDPHRPWRPLWCDEVDAPRPPRGALIVYKRAPARVHDHHDHPVHDWPDGVHRHHQENAPDTPPDQWPLRPWILVLERPAGTTHHLITPTTTTLTWWVLPEHYAICNRCGTLAPCTTHLTEAHHRDAADRLAAYLDLTDQHCWSCKALIQPRERTIAFDGPNLIVPAGPEPVRFHTRAGCRAVAMAYERRWHTEHPDQPTRLQCFADRVIHQGNITECRDPRCPGTRLHHPNTTRHQLWNNTADHCLICTPHGGTT